MKMTAPSPEGVSVGGQFFPVVDGYITVPDDFSSDALGSLVSAGFETVAQAPVEADPADPLFADVAPPVVEPDPAILPPSDEAA